jgi:hypothetical protein
MVSSIPSELTVVSLMNGAGQMENGGSSKSVVHRDAQYMSSKSKLIEIY